MYQSLHTTVIGPYGERIEIQIRTREMHRVAEYGIAAHWRYKSRQTARPLDTDQRFAWLRQMLEWQHNLSDPDEFLRIGQGGPVQRRGLRVHAEGRSAELPRGATVIDFAYRIHSEVGRHCAGARVNGKLVPLRYQLQSGDTVEIITTANQIPTKDWLKLVKTSRAKGRIRGYMKDQQSQRVDRGRARDPRTRPRAAPPRPGAAAPGRPTRARARRARTGGRGRRCSPTSGTAS